VVHDVLADRVDAVGVGEHRGEAPELAGQSLTIGVVEVEVVGELVELSLQRLVVAESAGRHPVVRGHRSRSLTDRRSLAQSPVASRGVPGPPGPAELMMDLKGRAIVAMARRGPGCTRTLPLNEQASGSDREMVHQ
jgi:hypothetical protein